jgi:hypothetical protein
MHEREYRREFGLGACRSKEEVHFPRRHEAPYRLGSDPTDSDPIQLHLLVQRLMCANQTEHAISERAT